MQRAPPRQQTLAVHDWRCHCWRFRIGDRVRPSVPSIPGHTMVEKRTAPPSCKQETQLPHLVCVPLGSCAASRFFFPPAGRAGKPTLPVFCLVDAAAVCARCCCCVARVQPGRAPTREKTRHGDQETEPRVRSNQSDAAEHRSGERRLLEIIEDQVDRALSQTSHQWRRILPHIPQTWTSQSGSSRDS